MKLPRLYKLSNGDKLQIWEIEVRQTTPDLFGEITTTYGQEDGEWQYATDVVREGKNLGKKNETSAFDQACSEARAKWRKQIERRGYVEDREKALAGKDDAKGGIAPMLAMELAKTKHIVYPCDVQRKYNGIRCLAIIIDGVCTLWSRGRQPLTSFFPHIVAAYQKAFAGTTGVFIFDGEVYRHGWSLQKIGGYAKKLKPGYHEIGHYVYDYPSCDKPWEGRRESLVFAFNAPLLPHSLGIVEVDVEDEGEIYRHTPLHLVQSFHCESFEEARQLQKEFVLEGYEGAILRNLAAPYEPGRRSPHLAKLKEYHDAEFKIIGYKDGRGKFEGCCMFSCVTEGGKEFDVCAPGTLEDRAEWFKKAPEVVGKNLTVKYFEWSEEGKPLQPVGIAVRDYE